MGSSFWKDLTSAIVDIAVLFGWESNRLWNEYKTSRGFSTVHDALLGTNGGKSLDVYLVSAAAEQTSPFMIDMVDAQGRSALAWAAEYGWADAAASLICAGATVNQVRRSWDGTSPLLHLTTAGPSTSLETVQVLLRAGFNVNAGDHQGWTTLHVEGSWNLDYVVREMIQCSDQIIDIGAVTYDGETAYDLAVAVSADTALLRRLAPRAGNLMT